MEIKSDVICKGESWYQINDRLVGSFFQTLWDAFKLSMSIGILYDNVKDDESDYEDKATISRTMFIRYSEELSYFFKTAILTSRVVDFSEKDRLFLAFSEDVEEEELEGEDREILTKGVSKEALEFDKVSFLKKFANYGADKVATCISNNDNETMENLMNFLENSYKGETEELLKIQDINEKFDLEFDEDIVD